MSRERQNLTPEEYGKRFLEEIISQRGDQSEPRNFDTLALSNLRNIRTGPGTLTCTLLVSEKVKNRFETLHGGCIATIVDTVGTGALVTCSQKSGVSLSISVDYLSPQPAGEEIEIFAKVLKVGKTIANIVVEIRNKQSQRLIAVGRHVKHIAERVITEPNGQQIHARL